MAGVMGVLTGWLLFATLVVTTGSLAARWVILPRAVTDGSPRQAWLVDAAGRLGRPAASALPAVLLLVFIRQVREFRDPFAPLAEDVGLLLGTPWGTAWLWSVVGAVAATTGFWLAVAGRRWGWWVATAAIIGLASFPGFTGHAAAGAGVGVGGLRWLTLLADTLHVLAAGAWVGGLTMVMLIERRWRRAGGSEGPESLLPVLVPAFSPVAVVSVCTLIITGVFASWVHVPAVGALWGTGYGRLLLLKVGLVVAVLGLGALNWKQLTPRLTEADGPRAMRRAATIELAVATVVLLVTAILVRTSPLGH